jgi:phosphatidylserine/phosphatidylglycerophosphate/cardiolipin synthase-like enzyme
VIDDRLAFVGGIDLSRWRWDTSQHKPEDPRRIDPNGKPYPPFHDMMMLVEGAVAVRLGDLARERWRRAHGWKVKPPGAVDSSPWPASLESWPIAVLDRILARAPLVLACCRRHESPLARVASDHFPIVADTWLQQSRRATHGRLVLSLIPP